MRVVIVLIAAIVAGAGPTLATVESATVQVDGLTCPFCAYGLEKQLKKLDGVEAVKIEVDAGEVTLLLAKGFRLTDPKQPDHGLVMAVRKAVEAGGFTPRHLRVIVSGNLETKGDTTALVVSGTAERITLDINAIEPAPGEGPVRVDGVIGDDVQRPVLEIRRLLGPKSGNGQKDGS
jgi:copper chaperone CopZ